MTVRRFDTVLVANRGEIAVRVIRTLRAMGIRAVAVYSDADDGARHVAEADVAVRIGPASARQSYLDIKAIVGAAARTGAQAVHPGYGFLAENAEFAAALHAAGIVFIGPPVPAIGTMGDKIAAKAAVSAFGVPVVPGISRPGLTDDDLIAGAPEVGFPVLVKPSAGGGGKGMRVVHSADELPAALVSARREAASAFGDDTLFLERFVLRPRHIEVQVLADGHGNVIHLGERECSLQRRHQKVIEEAPSPLLDAATRARIGEAACNTARSVDYTGAGTVEFIVSADKPDEFFFMEMNTRLQVEHPVTELVTGVDLVELQVRVAAGEPLPIRQEDVTLDGHAIEARVYAEDPANGFLPTGGTVLDVVEPERVRVDSGIYPGTVVGSDYDPMLAKIIAYADNRSGALRGLDRALAQTAVLGVTTNIDFLRFLLADPDVIAGQLDTGLLDRRLPDYTTAPVADEDLVAAAAYRWLQCWAAADDNLWSAPSGWRTGQRAPSTFRLQAGERVDHVRITGSPDTAVATVEDGGTYSLTARLDGRDLTVAVDGLRTDYIVASDGPHIWLAGPHGTVAVHEVREAPVRPDDEHSGDAELVSPMPGAVVAVGVTDGATVATGAVVVTVEAMKMEHTLSSPVGGVVELLVAVGDQVKVGQPLARITAATKETQQ
ncbi:acetyl-/propionyl-coenzyme A carboxylase subunit alpha [Mycolicibacterium canariasense]|uniref:biotin carboxylase n=1 Tax=Mycolicibacterium canariasense TaxID=228230 RepID=A0A100WEA2_MYCCR|nr:biotin carboxylase N-terminal domain-containing protein [Mycolicibacterium canariasense]MCV7211566.1 ATP-grasp domain-containing protein [Mycolicibacterium canariasense]ORV00369.1 acetyl/propionyl-CoA carboxylase subuit alpha [Mycolicibacterium canariasense]GAS97027.1 acetyl-/propionyl-coenzyme A carboxylase subunit alpha [Mycolicibacterium canariasense]